MQSQKCKICGHRHHRYEPHAFDDPKVKLMYESEPAWPAEYPGFPAAPEDPHLRVPAQPLDQSEMRKTWFPEGIQSAAPEDPRSNAQSPSHHTPDTADPQHTPYPRSIEPQEPSETEALDTPDTAPSPSLLIECPLHGKSEPGVDGSCFWCGIKQEIDTSKYEPLNVASLDDTTPLPPLAIVQEVIFDESDLNLGVPCFAPATWVGDLPRHFEMLDALTLAALDDTTLHSLRNLVMNEWMRRARRRKRATRKDRE